MRTLGLIPARGGSKGIPRKNLTSVAGRPLIFYTIESALAAETLTDVVVTTDDDEIASLAESVGANVPFRRPAEIAQDETPMVDVVLHAVSALGGKDAFDALCLLQPTSPLRAEGLIDSCVRRFETSTCDSLVTVRPIPHEYHPAWAFGKDDDGSIHLLSGESEPPPSRQLLPLALHRTGELYLTRTSVLLDKRSLYGDRILGYEVVDTEHVNIDTPEDLELAERLLSRSVP